MWLRWNRVYFSPETGAGPGGNSGGEGGGQVEPPAGDQGAENKGGAGQGGGADDKPKSQTVTQGKDGSWYFPGGEKVLTQEAINKIVEDRLVRDREARDKKSKEDKDREEGKWKELLDTREKELAELKPKVDAIPPLQERTNKMVDTRIKDWPASIKAMDPGPDDVPKRLDWLEKAQAAADEMLAAKAPPHNHGGGGGGGQGGGNQDYVDRYLTDNYGPAKTETK